MTSAAMLSSCGSLSMLPCSLVECIVNMVLEKQYGKSGWNTAASMRRTCREMRSLVDINITALKLHHIRMTQQGREWLNIQYAVSLMSNMVNMRKLWIQQSRGLQAISHDIIPALKQETKGKLMVLIVNNCQAMPNLSTFSALGNLQQLTLFDCNILQSLVDIPSLSHLNTLDLYGCHIIQDMEPISVMSNLHTLCLHDCYKISNIESVSSLHALKTLIFSWSTELTNISSIAALTGITQLELEGCSKLANVDHLSYLTNMVSLNLYECTSINSLLPLEHLSNLKTLDIRGCAISETSLLSLHRGICIITEDHKGPIQINEA